MNIHLSPELERRVQREAEQRGLDADTCVAKVLQETLEGNGDAVTAPPRSLKHRRPISERFEEIRRQAPADVQQALRELPPDFAAEHDHYIHGVPKKFS